MILYSFMGKCTLEKDEKQQQEILIQVQILIDYLWLILLLLILQSRFTLMLIN